MPMFHWRKVEALRNFAQGDIVVVADDVEAARAMAIEHAEGWLRQHRDFWYLHDGIAIDEESREDHDRWMAQLEVDLGQEPEVATIVYFPGSR